jgi:hypothetical protein
VIEADVATVPRVTEPNAPVLVYATVHVAVRVPAAAGVTQLEVPWSQLHVPVPEEQVRGAAPVSCAGDTVPPLTVTLIASIVVVVEPIIPLVELPSAVQTTPTVAPAATLPAGAWIDAVRTVTAASAAAGRATARASVAYTKSLILMSRRLMQVRSPLKDM